jgi:catechol 2,3-dioxygenase-like lactoylglutathione lyase family enzyme
MRPQPLIAVTDVPTSSRWYEELLRCESGHGGEEYERLLRDGTLVLQLHRFDVEHHHGRIGDPSSRPYGNGVALWFEVDDFDDAVERAARLRAEVVLPPHRNPPDGPGGPGHREIWLRDPDGYLVVLASFGRCEPQPATSLSAHGSMPGTRCIEAIRFITAPTAKKRAVSAFESPPTRSM